VGRTKKYSTGNTTRDGVLRDYHRATAMTIDNVTG